MVMEAAEAADKSRKDAEIWKEKYQQKTTKLAQAEQKVTVSWDYEQWNPRNMALQHQSG